MQFNDLYLLDVENKDWADLDMPWNVPRWNLSVQVVEAIPSWRGFPSPATHAISTKLKAGECIRHSI